MIHLRRSLATLAALALITVACGDDSDDDTPGEGLGDGDEEAAVVTDPADDGEAGGEDTDADVVGVAPGVECEVGETDGDLNLYIWSQYIDPDLKDRFADEFGVSVTEDNYDSNEAMQPVISAGNSGYDVIVPSDYMVSVLVETGDIMALNKDAIPNLANLAPEFASGLPFDPNGDYMAPYQWGTTGLGVDLEVTGEDVPHTWGLVFDEEIADEYGVAGSITMLNDPRETLGAALYYLGYSPNTTDGDELNEAKDVIADARRRVLAFESDQYDELLVSGESAVAHGYSGNFLTRFEDTSDPERYDYFVPEEGGTIWVDTMAVVADAPHPCTAHAFINFILDAENGAALTNYNWYASPNEAAEELIDEEVLSDPIVYPEDRDNLEFLHDTGDFEINYTDAFIEAIG